MICQICGNERSMTNVNCPFCDAVTEKPNDQKPRIFIQKTVNLEAGRPMLEVALNHCRAVIDDAKLNEISVITLIHGYGSSGKGGVIRSECRKTLEYMKSKRIINDYIAGEEFQKKSGRVRALFQRYPQLAKDRNLDQGNQGITLVIMSCSILVCCAFVAMTIFNATYLS